MRVKNVRSEALDNRTDRPRRRRSVGQSRGEPDPATQRSAFYARSNEALDDHPRCTKPVGKQLDVTLFAPRRSVAVMR